MPRTLRWFFIFFHESMSPFHSSSREMGSISKGNFKNFSSFDSSYNKTLFSSYDKLLDVENSHQINDVSDTSSTLASSHIFISFKVNIQWHFDLYENYEQNHPIYDGIHDLEVKQVESNFDDFLQGNIHREKIVTEEVMDSYHNDIEFSSKESFHCIIFSICFSHPFDFLIHITIEFHCG